MKISTDAATDVNFWTKVCPDIRNLLAKFENFLLNRKKVMQ